MKTTKWVCGAALAIGVIATSAASAPVSINDPVFGTGSITRAESTGLDWLDVTESTGLTYDFVQAEFGSGGQFEGFRHATVAEVEALAQAFGFPGLSNTAQGSTFAAGQAAVGLLGLTCAGTCGSFWFETLGLAEVDPTSTFPSSAPQIRIAYRTQFSNEGIAGVTGWRGTGLGNESSLVGHYLVREAPPQIPLPGTLVLLLGALGGVAVMRERRQTSR